MLGCLIPGTLWSQEAVRSYESLQAGAEAHAWGEQERRWAVRQQVGMIGQLQPSRYYDQTAFYFSPQYPSSGPFIASPLLDGAWFGPTVGFEPWPCFTDIWGYPYQRPIRQPIGQRQFQSGKRRWESHPIFADSVPAPAHRQRTGPREF